MARASSSCATAGSSTINKPMVTAGRLNGGIFPESPVAIAQWPVDTVESHTDTAVTPRVLIADDQPDVLEALRLLLKGEGYQLESVGSPAAILDAVDTQEFDVALIDLNYTRDTTSGQEGL